MSRRRTLKFWRWRLDLDRGGQATPWPWATLTLGRRVPGGTPDGDS